MDAATAWAEAMKFENRPNPYPYFEELRKTPVAKVSEKTYVVTGYPEAVALSHDPRISSDISRSPSGLFGEKQTHLEPAESAQARESSMLVSDPPDHDRMRRQFMRHFGPPHSPTSSPAWRGWSPTWQEICWTRSRHVAAPAWMWSRTSPIRSRCR